MAVQLQETTDPALSGWAWLELRAQVDSTVWAVWKGLGRQGGGGGGLCGGESWWALPQGNKCEKVCLSSPMKEF